MFVDYSTHVALWWKNNIILSLHAMLLKDVWSLVKQQAAHCQAGTLHYVAGTITNGCKDARYSSNVKNEAEKEKKTIPSYCNRKAEPSHFKSKNLSPIRTQFKKKEQIGARNLQRIFSSTWGENDTFSMC